VAGSLEDSTDFLRFSPFASLSQDLDCIQETVSEKQKCRVTDCRNSESGSATFFTGGGFGFSFGLPKTISSSSSSKTILVRGFVSFATGFSSLGGSGSAFFAAAAAADFLVSREGTPASSASFARFSSLTDFPAGF